MGTCQVIRKENTANSYCGTRAQTNQYVIGWDVQQDDKWQGVFLLTSGMFGNLFRPLRTTWRLACYVPLWMRHHPNSVARWSSGFAPAQFWIDHGWRGLPTDHDTSMCPERRGLIIPFSIHNPFSSTPTLFSGICLHDDTQNALAENPWATWESTSWISSWTNNEPLHFHIECLL